MTPSAYLDALLMLPRMSADYIKVSWDRRWVAWSWWGAGPAADVYVAPTDGSAPPTRLSNTTDDTKLVSWTPDSRAIIVAQDRDGDERVQLFRIALDHPLEWAPITEAEPTYYVRGGELHPNGRWLVYGANVDVATGQEIEPTWMYRHDLETGERRVLARPAKGGYTEPALSPTGTHVLYTRKDLDPAGRQVWLVDIDGNNDREILNFGPDSKTSASWFPDGERVLVLHDTATHRRLGVWERASGALRWLVDDPQRTIEDAFVPPGSDKIVLLETDQARTRASLLDPATGEETHLPAVPGTRMPLAPLQDGQWVAHVYSSQQPSDIVLGALEDLDPAHQKSVARVWERTSLRSDDLAPAEDFRWTSVDGLPIQGWLYRTAAPAQGTIVYVHGGPTAHSEDKINSQIQFFVRQGFNVLDPNYRGSTGFGIPFREAIKADGWGGREQDDLGTGIQALIKQGIAEQGKVGITGTSYGGYSSWCAITRWPPETIKAAAPICGMTDLVVDYYTTRPDLRPYSEEMLGGSPEQVPQRYRERSPINFVGNIKGHLLIVQGLRDPNVTPENVHAVQETLDQAGVSYDLLTFDDEGHGILKPHNQRQLFERLATFFEQAFADGAKHRIGSESSVV
jgi:dipeptidyl aminopeptidase/acylaminoacyl peptidase